MEGVDEESPNISMRRAEARFRRRTRLNPSQQISALSTNRTHSLPEPQSSTPHTRQSPIYSTCSEIISVRSRALFIDIDLSKGYNQIYLFTSSKPPSTPKLTISPTIMAPTESTILTSFLLAPAALPTIIPLSVFASYFQSADRTSSTPEIKRLYRSLQQRRALLTDAVAANIDREVNNGASQRRAIARARAQEKMENGIGNGEDEEVIIERAVRTFDISFSTCFLPLSCVLYGTE